MYKGIGVSPGVVVGPVRRIVAAKVTGPVPADIDQVLKALDAVAADLEHSAETIELEVGHEYQFRYLVDGTKWINDTEADKYTHSGVAAEENGVLAL